MSRSAARSKGNSHIPRKPPAVAKAMQKKKKNSSEIRSLWEFAQEMCTKKERGTDFVSTCSIPFLTVPLRISRLYSYRSFRHVVSLIRLFFKSCYSFKCAFHLFMLISHHIIRCDLALPLTSSLLSLRPGLAEGTNPLHTPLTSPCNPSLLIQLR